MKKNFTVNISGLLFHIDEDAFEALNLYLSRLKAHFTGTPGREEIIADIENRLAEMLQERSVGNAGIISLEIVKEVTSLMGDPTEFADGADEADTGNNAEIKRIFREPEDKYLGGVCGGLGAYFNIDPLWFRVAFVVLTLIGGSGILIYAVLWIAVPRARTTSDRLRMRGESVNISNIERSIREELNGIRDTLKDINYPGKKKPGQRGERTEFLKQMQSGAEEVLGFLASAFGGILLVFGVLTGIAFILLTQVSDSRMFGGFVPSTDLAALMDWVAMSGHDAGLLSVAAVLIMVTPIVIVIYTGLRLLFGNQVRIPSAYPVLFSVLVISSLILAFLAVRISGELKEEQSAIAAEEKLVAAADRSLTLSLMEKDNELLKDKDTYSYFLFDDEARLPVSGNKNIFTGMAELEVRPSPDSLISIQVIREALGADQRDAIRNLNQIPYSIIPDTGSCVIAGTFSFEDAQGWRNQRLKYIVRLPESYTLIINKMSARLLTEPEEFQSAGSLQLRNVGGHIKSSRLPSANAGHAQGGHTLDMMQYRPINLLTCMLDLIF